MRIIKQTPGRRLARLLGFIGLMTITAASAAVMAMPAPVPPPKPDFAQPAVTQLLASGNIPVPRRKPLPDIDSPLSEHDAALYRKIFAYQATASWDKADEAMSRLRDMRLRGHVLYQRYMHPTAYKSRFDELKSWLDSYADHPGAAKVYRLARKRIPDNFSGTLQAPADNGGVSGYLNVLSYTNRAYRPPVDRSPGARAAIKKLEQTIAADIARGAPSRAYRRLQNDAAAHGLHESEYDRLRTAIARGYMIAGKLGEAATLAGASAARSGEKTPLAGWVGGLTAWQQRDYRRAAALFEITARSPYASPWAAAAGAYWASRAHMRAGNVRDVNIWLRRAADHPRTFYGLIATRALGWDFDFNWDMPAFTTVHDQMLADYPQARRAMLLAEAGQYHLAEQELRLIDPAARNGLVDALFAYAHHIGLPAYAMRLAAAIKKPDGRLYDAALYPLSPWTPTSGYKIDQALLYAFIRQESRFNPVAENPSGATGLMQLMPATAAFVAGRRDLRSAAGRHHLKDPRLNIDIGQRYVEDLLYQGTVGAELFSLMIAYNAGPGNLRKWKRDFPVFADDPLLFVELIPMAETRAFVERVMANYWIYRLRMEQPTPSLDAVAEGRLARYVALDGTRPYKVATTTRYN